MIDIKSKEDFDDMVEYHLENGSSDAVVIDFIRNMQKMWEALRVCELQIKAHSENRFVPFNDSFVLKQIQDAI